MVFVDLVAGWLRRRGWMCVAPENVPAALPLIEAPPAYSPADLTRTVCGAVPGTCSHFMCGYEFRKAGEVVLRPGAYC